ncbi:MAG TPA: ABC transporter permease [Desulfuromonadaceae bacterium]
MSTNWSLAKRMEKVIDLLSPLVLPLVIIAIWGAATKFGNIEKVILPEPLQVVETFVSLVRSGALLDHLLASFVRIMKGFALGTLAGVSVGIISGFSRRVGRLLNPTIAFIRTIPIYAWIPMLILWFGIGESSKVIAITMGVFFPVHLSTEEGIRNIDVKYIEVAKILRLGRLFVLRKAVVPAALPFIITGIRLGLARAWMVVVVAELIAATSGLGYLISDGRQLFQPDVMVVGMMTIGIAGVAMDALIGRIERRALKWRVRFEGYREASL